MRARGKRVAPIRMNNTWHNSNNKGRRERRKNEAEMSCWWRGAKEKKTKNERKKKTESVKGHRRESKTIGPEAADACRSFLLIPFRTRGSFRSLPSCFFLSVVRFCCGFAEEKGRFYRIHHCWPFFFLDSHCFCRIFSTQVNWKWNIDSTHYSSFFSIFILTPLSAARITIASAVSSKYGSFT